MTIVNHALVSSAPNGNRLNVTYRFTDHLTKEHLVDDLVPAGTDTNADMLSRYAALDTQHAENEITLQISRAEDGEDILSVAQSPNYTTAKILVKRVIRHMMRVRDPYLVIALEPLIVYLRANYTNAQLLTFLTLTATQGTKMNSRINAILDNKAAFTTYDANLEDIDDDG